MKNKLTVISIAASLVLFSAAASADVSPSFSALGDAQALPLSAEQMAATTGELNAYDIAAALSAEAAKLAKYPKLQAADLKLAALTLANAVAINAEFQKLGILTPCKSCAH